MLCCAAVYSGVMSEQCIDLTTPLTHAVGNFINEGHMLGNAVGFTFESTNLLGGLKMSNKKGTLVHYLIFVLKEKVNGV